ncbi:DNA-directed RNA polymerases IV and V subunit 2-like protein, partial [Tanacetum coccineum]
MFAAMTTVSLYPVTYLSEPQNNKVITFSVLFWRNYKLDLNNSTRSGASASNQRKGIRARHNQLLNTTSVILEEYDALLQQLQKGSDPRLYGPTVKEVVQLPVEHQLGSVHVSNASYSLNRPIEQNLDLYDCTPEPFASGITRKARYLGYMVKSILEGYTSRRKVDNKDDFGNKRLELAGELLERELKVHLRHAQKRM